VPDAGGAIGNGACGSGRAGQLGIAFMTQPQSTVTPSVPTFYDCAGCNGICCGATCAPVEYFGMVALTVTWQLDQQQGQFSWRAGPIPLPQVSGPQSGVYTGVSINIGADDLAKASNTGNTIPLFQGSDGSYAFPDGTYTYYADWAGTPVPGIDGNGGPVGLFPAPPPLTFDGGASLTATCTLCGGEPVAGTGCNGPGENIPLDKSNRWKVNCH
jgi:hypothetical protein